MPDRLLLPVTFSNGSLWTFFLKASRPMMPDRLLSFLPSVDVSFSPFRKGHKNRRVGSHDMNKDSSRSHSLMTVHVESEIIDSVDGHAATKFGKIVFVDLAGSERLKDTNNGSICIVRYGSVCIIDR
jgi:hypothetical protein